VGAVINGVQTSAAGREPGPQLGVDPFQIKGAHATQRDAALIRHDENKHAALVEEAYSLDRALQHLQLIRRLDVVALGGSAIEDAIAIEEHGSRPQKL
jgi:hypothetical protein